MEARIALSVSGGPLGDSVSDKLVTAPHARNARLFLSGPAGTGKTTLAVRRLRYLLAQGVPAEQVLILVPQRTLAAPYYDALGSYQFPAGSQVDIATIGGLARRTIELFWPLISSDAGFAQPDEPPRFLTLETAQYLMNHVAEDFLANGAFEGIVISRGRLISQVIDNLNKSAAVGFPLEAISSRLKSAWEGTSSQLAIYDQVQAMALDFRRACFQQNLLDWSLQISVFQQHLLPLSQLRRYLLSGYRHLIVDNCEEDIPAAHDLLRVWLPLCESALLIYDTDGGYRIFLGADPDGARSLASLCQEQVVLTASHVMTPEIAALGQALAGQFIEVTPGDDRPPTGALSHETRRFHPQMLDWLTETISKLVLDDGIPPGEIAVLAPFLSDALRFSLNERLARFGIPTRSHRPSREIREEPAARCLLTLAELAHPQWRRPPPPADVTNTLVIAIAEMDPVRAQLITNIVYRIKADDQPTLSPFHQIVPETQRRISYLLGGRFDELRHWLQEYQQQNGHGQLPPQSLDHFLSRLFGQVLSQPGFGFHRNFDAGAVAANLIESIQKFRHSLSRFAEPASPGQEQAQPAPPGLSQRALVIPSLDLEYMDMVERGIVAASYISSWQIRPQDAVLLVPAYTFLMMNQPVDVQFWLDAGSLAWFERIYQPLTHPYVLRRDWETGHKWTDEDEFHVRQAALGRLILGLSRRCRRHIFLGFSELNERGYDQQGPLRQALQQVLRRQDRDL